MMKRYLAGLAALLALALTTPAAAQAPAWQWADSPGVGQKVHSTTDGAGNLYLTGHFSGTLQLGTSTLTPPGGAAWGQFIARRSAAGTYTWGVALADSITVTALAVDAQGDAYLTGGYEGREAVFGATRLAGDSGASKLFVAKLTAAGQWAWATSSATVGAWEMGQSLAVDGGGNVVVAGNFLTPTFTVGGTTLVNSSTAPAFQAYDMFVARLSPAGAWQWAASADGPTGEYATTVATDRAGRVVVGGYYYAAPTFGATPMPGINGLFVARLTPAGRWDRATGAAGSDEATLCSLALDAQGNTYATGNFQGLLTLGGTTLYADTVRNPSYFDLMVAKLDTAGRWQWAAQAGGNGNTIVRRVALAPGGQVLVAGYFGSATIGFGPDTLTNQSGYPGPQMPGQISDAPDGFVAGLSSGGAWQWGVGVNAHGDDQVDDLTVDATGTVRVVGRFNSDTLTMGGSTLLNPTFARGDYRLFVAQLPLATPTGLAAEVRGAGLALYPNPARHAVRLTGATGSTAVVLDALGRPVRTQALDAEGAATLDLTGLPAGLYAVRCGGTTRRLVVE